MSKNSSRWCFICLTNNEEDNVSDAKRYTDILIQLTNKKYCKDLKLCIWCKTILKKTIILKNLAVTTRKLLHAQNETVPPVNTSHYKHPHRLSLTAVAHTNVPSDIQDITDNHIILNKYDDVIDKNQSLKHHKENVIYLQSHNSLYTEDKLNLNRLVTEESNQTIDLSDGEIEYQNENKTPYGKDSDKRQVKCKRLLLKDKDEMKKESNKNKSEKINTFQCLLKEANEEHMKIEKSQKQSRIDLKLEALKFEVKYLNLEEQKKEIERKRIKYKYMKFQCDLCGVGYLTNDYFEAHQIRHTEAAGQYKCSVCSLHFRNQLVISQHTLSHRRQFSCMVCGARFSKWSNCIVHRQKCGGVISYAKCQICSKVFSDTHSLKVHKRVHNLQKQYSCEHCGTQFKTKQRLAVHIRSHTGAKPFSCSFCSRSFTTNSNLKAHGTVHCDVSEHYCVECNTHYKTAKSLKRHLSESVRHIRDRSHMFKCKECPKEFVSVKSLESHLTRHNNGLTEVKCPQCSKSFSSKSNLRKHMKCIHRNVSITPSDN